jgi:hypothetical protein
MMDNEYNFLEVILREKKINILLIKWETKILNFRKSSNRIMDSFS